MLKANPSVSICIPTYNGAEFLGECIASVLTQTYVDFEVLICDDRSSDGTLELAQKLAEGDGRFRFVANPTRLGLVDNWNNCVNHARGTWIKFVFQDDLIASNCVEKLLAACQQHGKPFAFCERDFIFSEGTPAHLQDWLTENRQKLRSHWQPTLSISPEQAILVASKDTAYNIVGEPTATLIKRSIFEELGDFDSALVQLCDSELWFSVLVNHGAAYVPESLATFRIHGGATTALNLGQRAFRKEILDRAVILYRSAFGWQYKPFRALNGNWKSNLSLRKECAAWAAYAWREAKKQSSASSQGQFSALAEWHSVISCHPGLLLVTWLGRFNYFLGKLKRTLAGGSRMRVKAPCNVVHPKKDI